MMVFVDRIGLRKILIIILVVVNEVIKKLEIVCRVFVWYIVMRMIIFLIIVIILDM